MTARARWRRIHEAHLTRLRADLDQRLARRRADRQERSARSRKGASTRFRDQLARDPLWNAEVPF